MKKILLKLFTDYYDLKEAVKKLRKEAEGYNTDIDILVFSPNSDRAKAIKKKYTLIKYLQSIMWQGDVTKKLYSFKGLNLKNQINHKNKRSN